MFSPNNKDFVRQKPYLAEDWQSQSGPAPWIFCIKGHKKEGDEAAIEPIVKEQILAVRDTCETNMFDVATVTKIALKMGFLELAEYLQNHKSEYCHFIIWGKTSEQEQQKKEDIPKQDRQKNR